MINVPNIRYIHPSLQAAALQMTGPQLNTLTEQVCDHLLKADYEKMTELLTGHGIVSSRSVADQIVTARSLFFGETPSKDLLLHAGPLKITDERADTNNRLLAKSLGEISDPRPIPVSLYAFLDPELLQEALGDGVDLKIDPHHFDDRLEWRIPGPAPLIWQVILSLVGHARRTMPQGGRLKLSATSVQIPDPVRASVSFQYVSGPIKAGDYMLLISRDTGNGIAANNRYERMHKLFHNSEKSTGLDLIAIREIIERMGGFIGVNSSTDEVGWRGTILEVFFPRAV